MVTLCKAGLAQDSVESVTDSTKRPINFVFSVGGGVTKFLGDVQDASAKANVHILGNRAAYDLNLGLGFSKSFTLNFNVIYGKLSGNENAFKEHRNFETQMVQAGINVEYNFAGLYKYRLPVVNPFLVAGAYYSNYFNLRTDLLYDGENQYNYWSDGTIRNLAETPGNRDLAQNVSRDFEYETLVKKSMSTFTASAGLGVDLHLSRAFSVRLMSRYFFSVNDEVDGNSTGNSAGLNDGFFLNQLSLVVNTMAFNTSRNAELPNYKFLFDPSQLSIVENEDRDEDGVKDILDKCAATPSGVKVDKAGCPLDEDVDGIPDYRDNSLNTGKDEVVDQTGKPIDYELVAEKWMVSENVYGINWDKRYPNPRFVENKGYTVNVATDKEQEGKEVNPRLLKIPELRKQVLNDSLIIYRLGVFEKFEDAESQRLELEKEGIYSSYEVPESYSIQAAEQLAGSGQVQKAFNATSYGMQEAIENIKASETVQSAELDYTVSRFERYLFDGTPEVMLVKDFLLSMNAFIYDPVVSNSIAPVQEKLDANPVPKATFVLNVPVDESEVEHPIMEEKSEPIVDVQADITTDELRTPESSEVDQPEVGVAVENRMSEPVPSTLTGAPLKEAIKEIRSTSNLKKQPRINYAPVKPQFKMADQNNDGLISAVEIQKVLDQILEGNSSVTTEQFNEMNAYFTDFTENVEPIDFGGTKVAFVNGVLTILKTEGGEYKEESRRLLAKKYKEADFNKDGELTPDEVQQMIDLFLKGGSSYSQEKVHELIDLYFE
ncbi:MAG: hypothetical protein K9J17_13430 [Flavobacteriales bacterium]|nr:hypothetical protein [Flavobacteriales bacterium]